MVNLLALPRLLTVLLLMQGGAAFAQAPQVAPPPLALAQAADPAPRPSNPAPAPPPRCQPRTPPTS